MTVFDYRNLGNYLNPIQGLKKISDTNPADFKAIKTQTPKECAVSFQDCVTAVCENSTISGDEESNFKQYGDQLSTKFAESYKLPIATVRYWMINVLRDAICVPPPPPSPQPVEQAVKVEQHEVIQYPELSTAGACNKAHMATPPKHTIGTMILTGVAIAALAVARIATAAFGFFIPPPGNKRPDII